MQFNVEMDSKRNAVGTDRLFCASLPISGILAGYNSIFGDD